MCKMANSTRKFSVYVDTTYKDIWEAAVGETVVCMPEPCNFHDRNTVAVEKDGRIFCHLPLKVSRVCAVFLEIGGTICCTVTGRR